MSALPVDKLCYDIFQFVLPPRKQRYFHLFFATACIVSKLVCVDLPWMILRSCLAQFQVITKFASTIYVYNAYINWKGISLIKQHNSNSPYQMTLLGRNEVIHDCQLHMHNVVIVNTSKPFPDIVPNIIFYINKTTNSKTTFKVCDCA